MGGGTRKHSETMDETWRKVGIYLLDISGHYDIFDLDEFWVYSGDRGDEFEQILGHVSQDRGWFVY